MDALRLRCATLKANGFVGDEQFCQEANGSVVTNSSIRANGSVGANEALGTNGSVGANGSVETSGSIGLNGSVGASGSVRSKRFYTSYLWAESIKSAFRALV